MENEEVGGEALPGLRRLGADLQSQGIGWALVGGVAIALRVLPRTTEDVDVMLAVTDEHQAEKAIGFLLSRGWRFERELNDKKGRISSIRLRGPGRGDLIVDCLIELCGIETEVVTSSELMVVSAGLEMPVANLAALIALKVLAGRPKDQQDIEALLSYAKAEEIQLARHYLGLIERRGFDRDKDLMSDLDGYLAQADKEGF